MDETTDGWPLPGSRQMAWAPPGTSPALSAVPLDPADLRSGMTVPAYREALATRVAWMVARAPSPAGAVRALTQELESRGLWAMGVPEGDAEAQVDQLLTQNPAWPDYLNLAIELPEPPLMARSVTTAVQAVKATTIGEWISLAFPQATDPT